LIICLFSDDQKVVRYMQETAARLKGNNLIKNPFNGYVCQAGGYYLVRITPIYPSPFLFGIMALLPVLWFKGFVLTWWLILPGVFLAASLAWSAYFHRFMMNIALKKREIDYTFVGVEDVVEVILHGSAGSIAVLEGCQEKE
jgi:hypothetical protein